MTFLLQRYPFLKTFFESLVPVIRLFPFSKKTKSFRHMSQPQGCSGPVVQA